MKNHFELGRFYNVEFEDGVQELLCYDISNKFAYLCPFKLEDSGDIHADLLNTLVYSLEEGDTLVESIILQRNLVEED